MTYHVDHYIHWMCRCHFIFSRLPFRNVFFDHLNEMDFSINSVLPVSSLQFGIIFEFCTKAMKFHYDFNMILI